MAPQLIRASRLRLPLLIAAAVLHAATLAAAKRSPSCPGGCIIAVTSSPTRQCACVQDTCAESASAPVKLAASDLATQAPAVAASFLDSVNSARAARTSNRRRHRNKNQPVSSPPQSLVPPRPLLPDSCGFCDRDYNTYESMEECMAAGEAFKPVGKGLDQSAYPAMLDVQEKRVSSELAVLRRKFAVSPATLAQSVTGDAGMTDASDITWVTDTSDVTAVMDASDLVVNGGVTARATVVCPWPITAPSGDGVTRTNCPVSALPLQLSYLSD